MCVATAPDRFAFDPGQHSRLVSELIGEDEAVRDARVTAGAACATSDTVST
jgi:hypothetical protein